MRTTILVTAALAAAAPLAAAVARSAPREAPLPESAGQVMAFAFDPANPKIVYAATEPVRAAPTTVSTSRPTAARAGNGCSRDGDGSEPMP
jgi:hypothetical protein